MRDAELMMNLLRVVNEPAPAWDGFRAPRFPADGALKLTWVAGLDFDIEVKKKICEVEGDGVMLWDIGVQAKQKALGLGKPACAEWVPSPKAPEQLLLPGQAPFGKEGDVTEDDVE